jgi:L-ascorbate metabolism protein UlaG (beta-lactamase superfamily)
MQDFNALSVEPGAVAILWLGQSSFVLKDSEGTVLMIDPYFPRERPPQRFIHPEPPIEPDQIKIDAVLCTHDHGDHTHPETLLPLAGTWPQARFYGSIESADHMRRMGIAPERVTRMDVGEKHEAGSWTVHVVSAKPPGSVDVEHIGLVMESGGVRLWVSGDPINEFAETPSLVEPVARLKPNVAIITWHPTEGEFPFLDGAVKIARLVGADVAIPSHYDCFTQRTYNPEDFAGAFEGSGTPRPEAPVAPVIIGYKGTYVYRA